MLEAFSRNGELGHWPKPNRRDPQLQKLHRRHRQIANKILHLKYAIENDRPTPQCQNICQEMRSLCTRLLGIEQEYWQRSGNSGLPPTFENVRGPNFATSSTLQDVLDESFLTREELDVQPFARFAPMPSSVAQATVTTEEPVAVETPPVEPKPVRKPRQNPQREQRLQQLLEHYGKAADQEVDPVAITDALWERDNGTPPPRFDIEEASWRVVPTREWIPEAEWPTAFRVSQTLSRYGENDHV